MNTWKKVDANSDFSIYNIPFGVYSVNGKSPRVGSIIGDDIIDLDAMAKLGIFSELDFDQSVFLADTLNPFIALGKPTTSKVRELIQQSLCDMKSPIKLAHDVFIPAVQVIMHMPVQVGDYTDFYSSIEHATNVGKMFRDPDNALLPNWLHLPVGYHGRASSIVVSGTDIRRPHGQLKPADGPPVFGLSKRVDIELEMAFVIGKESKLGEPIPMHSAEEYIFGMVLFNDWSARDIQKWEYVPLGPFLGKNFGSTISPWIVTLEALEGARLSGPTRQVPLLPYLDTDQAQNYDIHLEVDLCPEGGVPTNICKSNFKYMYWSMCQQLVHHTCNGCNVRVGDMMASGTISGPTEDSFGSMLELSWSGSKPIPLHNGQSRTFVEDGDTITLKGWATIEGHRVGFGEARGKIIG